MSSVSHGSAFKRWGERGREGVQRFRSVKSCQTCWEQTAGRADEEHNKLVRALALLWYKVKGPLHEPANVKLKALGCFKNAACATVTPSTTSGSYVFLLSSQSTFPRVALICLLTKYYIQHASAAWGVFKSYRLQIKKGPHLLKNKRKSGYESFSK